MCEHFSVKRLTGEVIEIACSGLKETVATLKLRIQDKENIPPDQQRIFFAVRRLLRLAPDNAYS